MAYTFRDKTALVTGASGGIGEAFARQLAARGAHLVLVARSQDRLEALADELARAHGVRVLAIAADLIRADVPDRLVREVESRNLALDILVNNAGATAVGRFGELDLARQMDMLRLNILAPTELAHRFLPGLLARHGALVNVASLAAFQPNPWFATYGASKAYVLSFSEAVWAEYRGQLRVLAVCPGITETNIFAASGNHEAVKLVTRAGKFGLTMTADDVVAASLKALERNRASVVTGFLNGATAEVARHLPRALVARLGAQFMR